jgi:integrase
MPKQAITDAFLRTVTPPGPDALTKNGKPKLDEFYWDTGLEGFGVRVKSDGSKHFVIQRKLPGTGESVRKTIGRWGDVTYEGAYKAAVKLLGKINDGVNPVAVARQTAEAAKPKTWQTFTLREALTAHVAQMREDGCTAGSIKQLEDEITSNLSEWMDCTLAEIIRPDDTTMLVERHAQLCQKVKSDKGKMRGGRALAARVFRDFRAIWNTARRRYPALLAYPTGIVNVSSGQRKRSPIPWAQLPAWALAVDGIENRVRADLQWFLLLTGSSGRGPLELEWKSIDFDAGTIHFPKPKGGEDRAFTVPASRSLLAMLAKRQLANKAEYGDTPYVFPTRDTGGKIVPTTESYQYTYRKDESGKRRKRCFFAFINERGKKTNASAHRLRDTFATACKSCKVDRFTTKLLMNHALPETDVTDGYMGADDEYTRGCVERVTAFLLAKAGVTADAQPTIKIA